jgi:hypothetical protein
MKGDDIDQSPSDSTGTKIHPHGDGRQFEVNHHREELMNGLQRHAQLSRC